MNKLTIKRVRSALGWRFLIEVIGIGTALGCVLFVLGHLVAFNFHEYLLIGESNKLILYGEIGLISFGLLCFIKAFLMAFFRDRAS